MSKKELFNAEAIDHAITRITYEIIEQNKDLDQLVIIGIKTRGVYIARRIREKLQEFENISLPIGDLDTRPFRDDEKHSDDTTEIAVEVKGKDVILVDDVLYTGRTIRAAIDGLIALGRPSRVQLAVLVDRGHRELPIRADYVGKNIPTSHDEEIFVSVHEFDGIDSVTIERADD
ncbi:MAG: bifunctional pyr operon transcriptional regulator/uracil phosphoribosyltransferase PyrR [Streptococcaceae bacterium]|nr:bifunctional pyr operon transcriptional regulator/uracil phosphoribosyltransferase PyrR [Streptococcaceae bacterium]